MDRLWSKGEPTDDLVLRYTVGDDHVLDARLVPYDVWASIAHGRMLRDAGYLSKEDFERIEKTLTLLAQEHAAGEWTISLAEEDVHTALENRLVQRIGQAGERIHLGRSRNDQVLAALRLYLRDAVNGIRELGGEVVRALATHERNDCPLPGYTHMQRAMPSSVGLWAGGFRAEIEDDLEGLRASLRRVDKSPLGSAAGYGTPGLALDRGATAAELDFPVVHEPVTAVQLSRGKAEAGVAFELALLAQDLGRLAADLCLFATSEFGFVKLPAAFTTGSSIMPQKRNPDVFELARARSAQVAADLFAILSLTSKLTSGYHRDLQLVKAPLFRSIDSTTETLRVFAHALPEVRFVPDACRAAMDASLHAAEEAYALVKKEGLSFREAYRKVGERYRG